MFVARSLIKLPKLRRSEMLYAAPTGLGRYKVTACYKHPAPTELRTISSIQSNFFNSSLVTCHSSLLFSILSSAFTFTRFGEVEEDFGARDAPGTFERRRLSLRARVEPVERLPDGAAGRGRARRARTARRGRLGGRALPRAPLVRDSAAPAQARPVGALRRRGLSGDGHTRADAALRVRRGRGHEGYRARRPTDGRARALRHRHGGHARTGDRPRGGEGREQGVRGRDVGRRDGQSL